MNEKSDATEMLPADHPLAGFEDLIDQLIDCGQLFYRRGWSVGTSSNYSVVLNNDPIDLIVTASGNDKGRLSRTDFVRCGAKGKPSSEGQPKSSAETMLHVILGEQQDVGCILHIHGIWTTLMSDHFAEAGGIEISGYEMLKGLEGIRTHETTHWIPIFENTQDIPALADEVAQCLSSMDQPLTHGFLIRNHGLYTWGRDVFAARRHVEIYEFLFECIGRKLALAGS